ncbi:CoA-transferase [Amycolatopsis acidicola]|uniref:CoA-transferase n=1 Tax=Amycolatopsis acidicola TaxID=2596893 RepID=A0A5N0UWQ4_9PSEU|nr:CoA-transferase [Amycolatopsis acidicola]KAA9157616.1 CoA-transferase [Amycolatopsis acidicola]
MNADLAAAVARVSPGDTVWLGNFGAQLFAVGEELIRQRARELHLVIGSGGLLLDRLIEAGVVAEATFAHCWSAVGPAPTRNFRRAWQHGSAITWHELPLGALSAALTAAARGVPFAPVPLHPETGYRDWSGGMLAEAASPFGAATVVRALPLDFAFVHASVAAPNGATAIGYPAGEAFAAAQAARHVVVVAEELGPVATADLPGLLVETVVVAPGSVAPDGVPGRYPRDVGAYA